MKFSTWAQTLKIPSFDLSVFDLNGERNVVRDVWDKMAAFPLSEQLHAKLLFTKWMGRMARYTGSIPTEITELRLGYCSLKLFDKPYVRNHLQSLHAIALVNAAEFAGNMALLYSLPDDGRFIVAGLDIDYIKKARGTILVEGFCTLPQLPPGASTPKQELPVTVTLKDASGDLVAKATLRSMIGPKKKAN